MYFALKNALAGCALLGSAVVVAPLVPSPAPQTGMLRIDLAEQLAAKKLRVVNRDVTPSTDMRGAVHLSEKMENGAAWVEGTDFAQGTIELEVRGRDLMQRSFLGVAFHRKDDDTYEVVYLRPFNFRAEDPVRFQHAVQYATVPEFDWPRLRKEFPEEFENPVDKSISPTDWVPLRVVVTGKTIQIFVGAVKSPTLEVRKLGQLDGGQVGLWVGNGSDGDFANLRLTPMK
jgi:hypothetical protein